MLSGELVSTSRPATNPPCLESRQAEAVPTLVLGAFLQSEVKFPVLRDMLIMAMLSMGKELNSRSFSSTLARSAGTRTRGVIQPTGGLALVLGCELM